VTIRFDDAWTRALSVARETARATGLDVILIRDILGRAALVVDDTGETAVPDDMANTLSEKLAEAAGPFTGPSPVTLASDLFAPEAILGSRDLTIVEELSPSTGRVSVLENGVVGSEWLHPQEYAEDKAIQRVALYGFKGGVGRSTATYLLAEHLANVGGGRCVLVVDLDLESPGVGALLQSDEELPDYGIVDYFAESAVGNQDGLEVVARSTRARTRGTGEVWVAPAGGRPRAGYDYLAKLNRVYADLPREVDLDEAPGASGLARRMDQAVSACEEEVTKRSRRPDVVLLDSRAGIHDIAAVTLTQLADLSLLFATDSAPSWNGYRALFRQWGQSPARARAIRERLRMVAAMVPRDGRDEYLERFRDSAQSCFAEFLYDNESVEESPKMSVPFTTASAPFNFAPEDQDAPHSPLPIMFVQNFVGIDLAGRQDWSGIAPEAYELFLDGAAGLIFGGDA
jgi:hypothetical protein